MLKRIALLIFMVVATSCQDTNVKDVGESITLKIGNSKKVYEWIYKDHIYLVVTGNSESFSVVHAGHCPCSKK